MKTDISGWQVRLNDGLLAQYSRSRAWQNATIAELAMALAAKEPDRITHVFEGKSHTIKSLLTEAQALASSLNKQGLRCGDVISFQLPNWSESMVINLAASLLGLVIAPIVPIYRDTEVRFMLDDCKAKAVFVPAHYRGFNYLEMMQGLAPQLPDLRLIVSVRDVGQHADVLCYEALVSERHTLTSLPKVNPNAVKLILYTSGTTGHPKGVLHSHNSMAYAIRSTFHLWQQGQGDTMLMASPVTHITGFGSGLELPLLCGLRSVFMERWDAALGLRLIDKEQVTISMGATPFLQELLLEAQKQGLRLPSLRTYACGGSAVPGALIQKAATLLENCRAFRVYGSSEVPLTTIGFFGPAQGELAAQTDGQIAFYDVRIVNDLGDSVEDNKEGEILVRGPAMLLGYTDVVQNSDSFDENGYFRTGDLGHLTQEDAIVITGRKKDLINRGGEKISAKEVEDILYLHPAIEEAAIVAMPHKRLGETVCAYVTLKDGQILTLDQLLNHLAEAKVARQKYPEYLVTLQTFPRTASGKVRKDELRRDIQARLKADQTSDLPTRSS
jgi:acyl-CoA synthetase (AMP-forming)/AMP-acid ligase II